MASSVTFPSVKPSSRSFTPGKFPSTDFESLDGTKTHIRFGNKEVNATLTLGFANISDAEVMDILRHYRNVNSDWDYVSFNKNSAGLQGIESNGLANTINNGTSDYVDGFSLNWRYSAPPTVTSTFNGLSNVSCSFVACLDAPI